MAKFTSGYSVLITATVCKRSNPGMLQLEHVVVGP
jgi:hypothetical protein